MKKNTPRTPTPILRNVITIATISAGAFLFGVEPLHAARNRDVNLISVPTPSSELAWRRANPHKIVWDDVAAAAVSPEDVCRANVVHGTNC